MDRKQHHRVVTDEHIETLIAGWHVCPYSDNVDELFATLRVCAEAYLKDHPLNTKVIVNIVRDLRNYLNPHKNKNMYYFTDVVCDAILTKYKNSTHENQKELDDYIQTCLLLVYTRV